MDMHSQLSSSFGHGFDFDASEARRYPEDEALEHVGSAIMHELLDVILGTPLEDHLLIAEGLLGGLHTAAQRLEREADKARDEINRGMRDFDGSEVADSELQGATARARACDAALAAVEKIRDAASAVYTVATGEVWSPWKGYIRSSPATAALMDARDAIRSARAARHAATSPGAVIVAFRASPQAVMVAGWVSRSRGPALNKGCWEPSSSGIADLPTPQIGRFSPVGPPVSMESSSASGNGSCPKPTAAF